MDIFCSARTTSLAKICFRLDANSDFSDYAISGQVRGPFCRYSRTLPCNFPVRNGETNLVDPCYWTPKLPFRYEVKLKIETPEGNKEEEFLWGIRRCLPQNEMLRLDGYGTVIRAVQPADEQIDLAALAELKEHSSALLTHHSLDARIYDSASELGVMIVDASPFPAVNTDQHRNDLHRYPAVHFRHGFAPPADILQLSKFPDTCGRIILVGESELSTLLDSFDATTPRRPIFVERKIAATSLSDMRKTCDWLQRDLASLGQFAGYLVSLEA